MKTRVISTEIWDEDKVFSLNIDTKLLYLVLLTNPYIGQTKYYKINDRQLSTFTGLNVEQIQKCKKDLSVENMAHFKNGWVCITGYGFIECFYKGKLNEIAKQKELDKIPSDVLDYFDTLCIPYVYPIDTTINTKSETISNKSRIINQESKEGKVDKVAEIIKAFEVIDPKNKNYYGNKTQRKAVEFLIKEYSFDKVLEMISFLDLSKGKVKYLPSITSPFELQEKWQKVIDIFNRKKADIKENLDNVIWE